MTSCIDGAGAARRLALPIGVSEFEEVAGGLYYVDKTLMVRDLIDDGAKAVLITRPRRFGKSLNMGMLRCFFDVPRAGEDTAAYFRGRKVWGCGDRYTSHQGRHPVVSLSLKGARRDDWARTYEAIENLVMREADRTRGLVDESALDRTELESIRRLWDGTAGETDLAESLRTLTSALAKSCGAGAVVLVDEYDVPISHGFHRGFYREATDFMRVFLGEGLKDNPFLFKGVLTGVLRVAKEGMFSGFNNPQVYTVLDERYSEYFGLTPDEVRALLAYYGQEDRFGEVQRWYDGYLFGATEIYNPWSVLSYVDAGCAPEPYWVNTSENAALGEIVSKAAPETLAGLRSLVEGGCVSSSVDVGTVYPNMAADESSAWSYLLMAGYLKASRRYKAGLETWYDLEVPNLEVRSVYGREVLASFSATTPREAVNPVAAALVKGDPDALRDAFARLLRCASVRDLWGEAFYQGFVLALVALLDGFGYKVDSNREGGDGYFDVQLDPRGSNNPGIVVEIKALAGDEAAPGALDALADEALGQIREKDYAADLRRAGVEPVLAFGVAFRGRDVSVASG